MIDMKPADRDAVYLPGAFSARIQDICPRKPTPSLKSLSRTSAPVPIPNLNTIIISYDIRDL